jgi:hypothetical protein
MTVLAKNSSNLTDGHTEKLRVAVVRSEKMVAEAGDISGTQRNGKALR